MSVEPPQRVTRDQTGEPVRVGGTLGVMLRGVDAVIDDAREDQREAHAAA